MNELNIELWKLGISSKTQHNEVAPNQFELAPIFSYSNIATDHNQLVMQTMRKVAKRHGLVCLLHEKPFRGVNGSGKHNNWSLGTDDGVNLLDPGKTPEENLQFLVFVSAVLEAVDSYAPLLRLSAANTGNDHRLGANEAPPAIISIFLGEQLQSIFESIAEGKTVEPTTGQKLELGVTTLPKLPKDLTDRNRTSPFAFTGNKFEFRMVPSSESIAAPNFILNTIVAEVLDHYAEKLSGAKDLKAAVKQLVTETWKKHSRIVFNGNGYTEDWVTEAAKRGLPNLKSSVEAWPYFGTAESVALFEKHKILSKEEVHARLDIVLEKYSKQINIEAGVAWEMATREILPACAAYAAELAGQSQSLAASGLSKDKLHKKAGEIAALVDAALANADALAKAKAAAKGVSDPLAQAKAYRDSVFSAVETLREGIDKLEKLMPRELWPMPTYEELLFGL
jgi:glutamine synthetase